MNKMGKELIDLTTAEKRQSALLSLERLDDFNYPLDLDGLTPKETEMQQRMAEAIEFDSMCSELLKRDKARKYVSFLNEVEVNGVSFKKVEDAPLKRNLLSKYFSVRYQRQGIDEYSPEKLNEVFLGFVNYARKIVRKSKH